MVMGGVVVVGMVVVGLMDGGGNGGADSHAMVGVMVGDGGVTVMVGVIGRVVMVGRTVMRWWE